MVCLGLGVAAHGHGAVFIAHRAGFLEHSPERAAYSPVLLRHRHVGLAYRSVNEAYIPVKLRHSRGGVAYSPVSPAYRPVSVTHIGLLLMKMAVFLEKQAFLDCASPLPLLAGAERSGADGRRFAFPRPNLPWLRLTAFLLDLDNAIS